MITKHAEACRFTVYSGGQPWRTHRAYSVFFDDDSTRGRKARTEPTLAINVVDQDTGEVIRYPGWTHFAVAPL